MLRKARYKAGVNATKHTSLLAKNSNSQAAPVVSGGGNNNNNNDDDEFIWGDADNNGSLITYAAQEIYVCGASVRPLDFYFAYLKNISSS